MSARSLLDILGEGSVGDTVSRFIPVTITMVTDHDRGRTLKAINEHQLLKPALEMICRRP